MRSAYGERIERAARQAGLPVQRVDSVASVPPEAALVGVGPSVLDPLDVARDLRRRGAQPLLLFFAASASARESLQAELIRDPFLYPRFELIEVPDSAGQLAARLGRVAARIERQAHTVAPGGRGRGRSRVPAARPQPISSGEHFFASLLAQSVDAIVSADVEGRILTWNQAAERLFEIPAPAALGGPLSLLDRCAGEGERIEHVVQRVLTSLMSEEVRLTCPRGADDIVFVAANVAAVRDTRGVLLGVSIVARDDSDYQRIQTALEDANRQKDEFLAIMSHELRTPLTSILGYTDMLLRGLSGPLGPMAQRYVGNVRLAGDRLLDLVNGLLDFTRLEAGVERLELQAIDLPQLVRQQVRRCRDYARAKDIELRLVVDDTVGRVPADAEKVVHVVHSIVGNALKFTSGPGLVEVRVAPDPVTASNVRVSVIDSGIGMREDQLERVWERFYQGDASLTRAHGGMGLGLSIARHLVVLHGGTVGAESRGPGLGSTFWFSLPRVTRRELSR